jgi:hypothetical protein
MTRIFGFSRHRNRDPWEGAPHYALEIGAMLGTIIANQETIMSDISQLQAVAARLQASDADALSLLQHIKDQNTELASKLASVQAEDPAEQQKIDDVVAGLKKTADAVDAAVAANPQTTNLTPSPTTT